uniref:Uncharacterized protein n=1 Tax=Anguilla anguilla TaxID=7936 RepID=A0A0E9XQX9_ANGAN
MKSVVIARLRHKEREGGVGVNEMHLQVVFNSNS